MIDRVLCDADAEVEETVAYRAYVTREKVFNVRYEFNPLNTELNPIYQ